MIQKENAAIGHRTPLVKNLLLAEGITRSGKFLLANILNGFEEIEPAQTHVLLEYIPILEAYGFIDRRAAKEMLQCEIDVYCYEMLIGRTLNQRPSDKSSIFHMPEHGRFLNRITSPDGLSALQEYYDDEWYSLFVMHEVMPNFQIYFDTFPDIKVIHIQRNPIGLVYSWYKRGYAERLAGDPTFFMFPFNGKYGPVPWFAVHWEKSFYDLGHVDRVIASIVELDTRYREAYAHFASSQREHICIVRYEDILADPNEVIKRIAQFIKKKERLEMKDILVREKLPNNTLPGEISQKRDELKTLASPEYFDKLIALEQLYYSHPFGQ